MSLKEETWYRVPDVAARMGVSPRMIWRLIAGGNLEVVRLSRRKTVVAGTSIQRFMARCSSGGER